MRKFILILYCLAAFLQHPHICGGAVEGEKMNDNKTIVIKKQDNGRRIDIKCGDLVRIELASMGGAGYSWHVDDLNTQYLDLVSEETRTAPGERVGAPVVTEWLFKSKKRGSTKIKMDNYRVWEGKGNSVEHFSIELSIE